ncbi:hypothetical protein SCOCK_160022 [Actinacidiphila cocklensis]|uniref:Uncharacterized protein n=1 Tax=Actinacidiphila cocklensis TaxID=887465 RepID=A0A9W4E2U7_9ACTN|nr:hypothetical protein SCOCK_160022 [Actinacidiphila cocklensis]
MIPLGTSRRHRRGPPFRGATVPVCADRLVMRRSDMTCARSEGIRHGLRIDLPVGG